MSHHKLSFWTAVLVNLNVMFGAGIFINTITLTKLAGFVGFLSYALVAVLLVPLILSIAALLHRYPEGGFYAYAAKNIHPFLGFISSWAYFTGKLASASLLVHVFCSFMSSIFQFSTDYLLLFDALILVFFAWLNILHAKTGKTIMYTFMMFKIIPILFAILCCLYFYNSWSIPSYSLLWSGIPTAVPIVLFAFIGFEVCCSLSDSLENAEKNGPRVVFLTYAIVVGLTIIYQLLSFLSVGPLLMVQESYLDIFPTIFKALGFNSPWILHHLVSLLHIVLACASLGGCYGILFSNHWNLYALAKHNHTFFPTWLTRLNRHGIPAAGILIEACLCIFYLYFTRGTVVILQQLSVLGCIIAYTLSVLGLLAFAYKRSLSYEKIVGYLALGSCTFFILASIRNFYLYGLSALYLFIALLIFGIAMFLITKKHSKGA